METSDGALTTAIDPAVRLEGFTALYDNNVVEVYRFVHRLCRDRQLAEDITQDAFLTAVGSVRDPAGVSVGWLVRVARNRLLDVLRRQERYAGKLRLLGGPEPTPDHSTAVANQIRLTDALEQLNVEQRLVLTLHYVEGLTVADLATELGRSPKTVEARITKARRALRTELEDSDV